MKTIFTKGRLEKLELFVRIIAIFIAGLWAVYLFYYQTKVAPRLQPTVANIKIDFTKVGEDTSQFYYYLRVTLKNQSSKVEKFSASYFNIQGYRIEHRNNYNPHLKNSHMAVFSKYMEYVNGSNEFFYGGKLFDQDMILTPLQENNLGYLVTFPKDTFDVIDVQMNSIQCNETANVIAKWSIDSSKKISAVVIINKHDTIIDLVKDKDFIESNSIYFLKQRIQYYVGKGAILSKSDSE